MSGLPRDLLFGLLALQNGLINRDQLVMAFTVWTASPDKPLAELLLEQGALRPEHKSLLEALVETHLGLHGGDPEKSLAALEIGSSTRTCLTAAGGPEVEATLGHVGRGDRVSASEETASFSFGSATSGGQRFRVIRPHARGGLGEVFIATDEELNREVALKQILEHRADDQTSRQRFVLEAEITGGLEHPGIVPVYGLGSYGGGRPYYAMRFIRGDSLKEAIAAFRANESLKKDPGARTLELQKLLRRFVDVCNAIAYAHSRGVLHRDIKPGNVIVGRYGETLVVDWGLAKATGRHDPAAPAEERTLVPSSSGSGLETLPGRALGTPAYMSPEQAVGDLDRLGPASDVYSLGATLYCLLTGKPPFQGETGEVLRRVQRGEFARPRQVDPRIDPALEAVCLKAMALEPAQRYATCRDLADDVGRWMADEPVTAWREPLSRRARRWTRRHRTAVTAAALAGLTLLVALGIGYSREAAYSANLARINKVLDAQRRRAEDREQEAIAAVKRFGEVVSKNRELKDRPELESLRKELLREPLSFFKSLRDRLLADRETRPESLARLASACSDLGSLTNEIGDKQDALIAFRDALAIFQRLADAKPTATQFQGDLARSHNSIGVLLSATGQPAEALRAYEQALAIRRKLADANPTVTEFQSNLAASHDSIGILLSDTGWPAEALRAHEQALAIRRKLADVNPTVTEFQSHLAASHNNIGVQLSQTGQPAEALRAHEQALVIRRKLADANPTVTEFQNDLAASHGNIGLLLRKTGQPAEAPRAYEQALAIWQKLADANPTVTEFQSHLAASHNNIGALLSETGQPAEALRAHEQALAIRRKLADANPTVTEFQSHLAASHNRIGALLRATGQPAEALRAHEQALAIRRKLADANPTVTAFQRDLAASHDSIGILLSATGQPAEALRAYEQALAIRRKLADANPTVTEFQSDLAASHDSIGILLSDTGRPAEALRAHEQALAIRRKLADVNPTVTEFQSHLAASHNNIGVQLSQTGQPAEALRAHEQALVIRRKLADANPTVTEFQNDLAASHGNIGLLLRKTGQPAEAPRAYEQALAIWQKLADANPTVTEFQSHLAASHNNIGILLSETGQPAEALRAHEQALAIRRKLADANPTVTEFQSHLAASHDSIGILLSETGQPAEALRAYEQALAIRRKLADDHPESPEYASNLSVTLSNLALLNWRARRFPQARDRLREAITCLKKALAANPRHPASRQYLDFSYRLLLNVANDLHDAALAAEARRGQAELDASDPRLAALDARLAAVVAGAAPVDNRERLALAQRAYDTERHATAASLWADALAADPALAEDRQAQHPYNAACAAALAAAGQGQEEPPLDDAARTRLRAQALAWLQAELGVWKALIQEGKPDQRQTIDQTLQHWRQDSDLTGVRDPDALARLPAAERDAWRALWTEVARLLPAPPSPNLPDLPADVFAKP